MKPVIVASLCISFPKACSTHRGVMSITVPAKMITNVVNRSIRLSDVWTTTPRSCIGNSGSLFCDQNRRVRNFSERSRSKRRGDFWVGDRVSKSDSCVRNSCSSFETAPFRPTVVEVPVLHTFDVLFEWWSVFL